MLLINMLLVANSNMNSDMVYPTSKQTEQSSAGLLNLFNVFEVSM